MTAQLPLALRWPHRQRFEHFHPGANAAALDAVQALAQVPGAPWVYLHGPRGSGRSHLLMAACQASLAAGLRVQYLALDSIDAVAKAIRGVAGSELLALDDLDSAAGQSECELALFDLYNRTRDAGGAMLFAAAGTPATLGIGLPDLRSRLNACSQFALRPLDDAQRRAVLKAHASARGLLLEDVVIDWLVARYARDLGTLLGLLDRLDQASLAAQRRITVPFLRSLLQRES